MHKEALDGWDGDNSNRLKVSVRIPALGREIATRAEGGVAFEEGENTIKSLYLLFFTQTTDRSGEFIDWVEVALPENDPTIPENNLFEMNIDTEVAMESPLASTNAYNILALGNVMDNFYIDDTVEEWMDQWAGFKENEVMATAIATLPTAIAPNSLLMHGRMEKPAGESQVHLSLDRDVSRFDVINNARSSYDLVTVSIWNSYGATTIWSDGIMDYSSSEERTRFHYTFNNEGNIREGETDILDDIKGGLYAFENRVSKPEPYDNLTTCLIVGLSNRADGKTSYYRVNMTNDTGAQQLHRNDVYSLTITGVTGEGAPDEETAYLGESNRLIYSIGNWKLDDNGLIVRDEYSILSIPTKKVTIGKEASTVEISAYTFSTLPSPTPLTVRSQTYRPVSNDIQATLDGNTLVITATALELDEQQRNGVIVLSYAGLEIALDVMQSGIHDDYLYVTLPDGGIPRFPAYSGISSGLITVQASGPWTAKMYLGGFSFNPSISLASVMEITSENNLVIPDEENSSIKKFRIYTHSFNTKIAAREEIIFITLDKDPDTYQSIVLLSQDYVKKLYVTLPDGSGNYDTGATKQETASAIFTGAGTLASTTGNRDKFFVISGRDSGGNILRWGASIVMNGLTDDSQYFEVVNTEFDPLELSGNYVTVRAKGINTTGRELKATLRVQTDPGTFADITLIQQPAEWDVPNVTSPVPATGGETAPLKLDAFEDANYTVEIVSVSGVNSDHWAYVAEAAGGTPYSKLQPKGTDKSFVVGFPKMIYPNLYSPALAMVKVTIVESGESKTFVVTQAAPTMYPINILDMDSFDPEHGQLSYANTTAANPIGYRWSTEYTTDNYRKAIQNAAEFGPNGIVKTAGSPFLTALNIRNNPSTFEDSWNTVIANNIRYIHYSRPGTNNNAAESLANLNTWNWVANNEGVVVINGNENIAVDIDRMFDSNHLFGMLGLQKHGDGYNGEANSVVMSDVVSRVRDYVYTNGPFGEDNSGGRSTGYKNFILNSSIDEEGQFPIMVNTGGSVDENGGVMAMVDAKRRIVALAQTEGTLGRDLEYNWTYMKNLRAWIMNTAQFGSHFSEYFWDSPRYLMNDDERPQPQPLAE
jgi:hypothetical protein